MPNLATATSVFAASGLKTGSRRLFSRNPSVTTFGKVFQNCAALTTLPDGLFAGNPKVTTYSNAGELHGPRIGRPPLREEHGLGQMRPPLRRGHGAEERARPESSTD